MIWARFFFVEKTLNWLLRDRIRNTFARVRKIRCSRSHAVLAAEIHVGSNCICALQRSHSLLVLLLGLKRILNLVIRAYLLMSIDIFYFVWKIKYNILFFKQFALGKWNLTHRFTWLKIETNCHNFYFAKLNLRTEATRLDGLSLILLRPNCW